MFRFGAQGSATPPHWGGFDEASYQKNWNFIIRTIRLIDEELRGSDVKIIYDLQVEAGGAFAKTGQRDYVKRLWADFTATFPDARTKSYGFSYATLKGRIAKMYEVYDEVGIRPSIVALDLYDNIYSTLSDVVTELRAVGEADIGIIIQETYYNDEQTSYAFAQAITDHSLDVLYMMQWPNERGSAMPHFSVDFTERFDFYYPY